jgi:hypothetical protein
LLSVARPRAKCCASQAPQIPHNGQMFGSDNFVLAKVMVADNYTTTSDARLKTNIADLPPELDKVLALKVKTFDKHFVIFGDDDKKTISGPPHSSFGLIAQEARKLFPLLVYGDESKDYLSLHESKVGFLLLAAFQQFVIEARKEVAEPKAKINGPSLE